MALGMTISPPPPCPNTGLSKHGAPVVPYFWFFWNHCFCRSNAIKDVVGSSVQAAQTVNMGVKVLV